MKISLPPWLVKSPEKATTKALEQQLSDAEAARSEALEAVKEAQAAFDADPSKQQPLQEAESLVLRATAHVDRAKRLLESKRLSDAGERREMLAAKRIHLERQLETDRRIAREEMPERIADLLLQATRVQAEREILDGKLREQEHELAMVVSELEDETELSTVLDSLAARRPKPWIGTAIRLWEDELRKLPGRTDQRFASPMESAANALKGAFR